MQTQIIPVDAASPEPEAIARAAAILRAGGLVAFPTETVYGLGANAFDPAAVARIFVAKGRPSQNPLIVHVASTSAARALAATWPEKAETLAQRFWPGPLTLVLAKTEAVPDIVTAGGGTVAVRVPAHPVALALLRSADAPVAAPSANRSTELSPTRAEHVLRGLDGRIDMLLDAGPTAGGLESTVLDVTANPARLLRPGLIGPAEIEAMIGAVVRPKETASEKERLRSPGMLGRHYAPRTPLECVSGDGRERVQELCRRGVRVGWLTYSEQERSSMPELIVLTMPADAPSYAAQLYAALHVLDASGVDYIIVELPPAADEWLAVRDRLRRARLSGTE